MPTPAAGCGSTSGSTGYPLTSADPGVAGQIGALLGRLHAHALPPHGPADPWYETVPAPETWTQLAAAGRAQGLPWSRPLSERADLLRDLAHLVAPTARDQMLTCHRDLHPDNVLVDGSGELIPLDWDESGPACPGQELAGLVMFWHLDDHGTADDAAVERTLRGYYGAGGPGRLRDERSFGMYLAGWQLPAQPGQRGAGPEHHSRGPELRVGRGFRHAGPAAHAPADQPPPPGRGTYS